MPKLSNEQRESLIKEYINGEQTSVLSKKYNITNNAIYGLLKRRNIAIRPQTITQRKYTIKEDYFDAIDNEQKAYIMGFLYADGSNYSKKNTVSLKLKKEDIEILQLIREAVESNKPIREAKNYYSFDIENKHISQKLYSLGVVDNKTFLITFPEWLKSELYPHFIRGYFDGDGYVGIYKKEFKVSLIGTEMFCAEIKNILKDVKGINCSIRKTHNIDTNIRELSISGNNQALIFLNYIYEGSSIFLKRKHDRYIDMLNLKQEWEHSKMKICNIENCNKKHYGKGYCKNHYYKYCGGKEKRRERYKKLNK